MKKEKIYQSIIKIVSSYSAKLAMMNENEFQITPPNGGWSLSEVYSHIFDSSLLSLIATEKCINGEGKFKNTTFLAKALLFFGSFPPNGRYKAPSKIAERVKKINITAAQQLIIDFELQLAKIFPKVASANPKVKIKHPKLGYLNAEQWLKFIEIHLGHHLKQLNRITKSLNN